ncbi:MAG: hypothetical protein KDA61_12785 [Planctomycetales bacterium]|nr:hypothetical protein [Planctomycetales bacterium]
MNLTLACYAPLLAQMSRWSRLGDGLRPSRNSVDLVDLLPFLLLVGIVVVAAMLFNRRRIQNDMSLRCDDPPKLFRELCLAHQVAGARQRALRQLAEAAFPDHPARVFLSPSAFDPANVPESLQGNAEHYAELRQKLFAI